MAFINKNPFLALDDDKPIVGDRSDVNKSPGLPSAKAAGKKKNKHNKGNNPAEVSAREVDRVLQGNGVASQVAGASRHGNASVIHQDKSQGKKGDRKITKEAIKVSATDGFAAHQHQQEAEAGGSATSAAQLSSNAGADATATKNTLPSTAFASDAAVMTMELNGTVSGDAPLSPGRAHSGQMSRSNSKKARNKRKKGRAGDRGSGNAKLWIGAGLGVLVAFSIMAIKQDNVKVSIDHTDVSLGGFNITLPVPSVEVQLADLTADLNEFQTQLAAKLGTLYAAVSLGNISLAQPSALIADWLPSMDTLSLNMSVGEALDKLWGQLPGFGNAADQHNQTASVSGRPGKVLAKKGYRAKHPVVIIPGFVTSQLELWQGQPCAHKYFRQRMWGTMSMMQTFLRNSSCWFQHLALDLETGLDPPGVKLRAAQGLEAVDSFVQGYWVWGKLVEALADVGYDTNTLTSMAYDWRLAVPHMEVRDAWFTRTLHTIEMMKGVTGHKAVLVSHSYGENVARTFLHWAEGRKAGWVDSYVHAHVQLSGPTLGLPKAASALLSGEMRDTAQLGALASFLTDRMMPRQARARLFRSWASMLAMLPVGGSKVWGNATWAPDDTAAMRAANRSYGSMVTSAPLTPQAAAIISSNATRLNTTPSIKSTRRSDASAAFDSHQNTTGDDSQGDADYAAAATDLNTAADAVQAGGARSTNAQAKASATADRGLSDPGVKPNNDGSGLVDTVKSWFTAPDERAASELLDTAQLHYMDVAKAIDLALQTAGPLFAKHYKAWGAVHGDNANRQPRSSHSDKDHVKSIIDSVVNAAQHLATSGRSASDQAAALPLFPNALTTPLPHAPNFKMYCFYGVGIPTERAYHYLQPQGWSTKNASAASTSGQDSTGDRGSASRASQGGDGANVSDKDTRSEKQVEQVEGDKKADQESAAQQAQQMKLEGSYTWRINTALHDPTTGLDSGIQMDTGDLTVPLISLGAMCRGGWKSKRLNPSGSKIVTKEYAHQPVSMLKDPRGGPASGSHVDFLGNEEMLQDVISIATGAADEVQDRVVSRIDDIVKNIPWEEEGGWQ